MPNIARIIDANANRAREAIRVMEDAARFALDDAKLAGALKSLRHDLAAALAKLPDVAAHRDTVGDVGTAITTKAERSRSSMADVVTASGKRLAEALRCLEEFGKLIDADFAAAIKQIRYRAYTLEQSINDRVAAAAVRQWRLCVLITESLCTHHAWLDVAKASLDAGADCIQLREKSLDDGEWLDRAGQLVDAAAKSSASIIINDRPDIALAAGAHGVHLGQHDLPIDAVRRVAGHQLIIGVSTHNIAEARRAVSSSGGASASGGGADYCGVGAMYATATKQRKPAGLDYLRRFVQRYPNVPHLAIGGITPANIDDLAAAGARGVAVSSVICQTKQPGRVVRRILKSLR